MVSAEQSRVIVRKYGLFLTIARKRCKQPDENARDIVQESICRAYACEEQIHDIISFITGTILNLAAESIVRPVTNAKTKAGGRPTFFSIEQDSMGFSKAVPVVDVASFRHSTIQALAAREDEFRLDRLRKILYAMQWLDGDYLKTIREWMFGGYSPSDRVQVNRKHRALVQLRQILGANIWDVVHCPRCGRGHNWGWQSQNPYRTCMCGKLFSLKVEYRAKHGA